MLNLSEQSVRAFRAEILLSASLRHPNIVNFVGACWSKELMCLVLFESLGDLLKNYSVVLDWSTLLGFAIDISRGM